MSKRSSPIDISAGDAAAPPAPPTLTSTASSSSTSGGAAASGPAPSGGGVAKRTRGAAAAASAAATAGPGGGSAGAGAAAVLSGVVFSKTDSAPQLGYSRDYLEVTGEKGYRMARATEGVYSGSWYWEAEVLEPEDGAAAGGAEGSTGGTAAEAAPAPSAGPEGAAVPEPHFRMGWALRQADTQAPVGYDKNSYGYRDVAGAKVHQSLREDDYGEPYGPGDVIGFGICLPVLPEHMQQLHLEDSVGIGGLPPYGLAGAGGGPGARSFDSEVSSSTSGAAAAVPGAEEGDEELRKELEALGNHIRFFKNGRDQGPAYTQLSGAKYYPAVSLYMGGRVRANFGPSWICDPREHGCRVQFRPLSELKEPLKKEEMQNYLQYINERRSAFQARHGPPSAAAPANDAGEGVANQQEMQEEGGN